MKRLPQANKREVFAEKNIHLDFCKISLEEMSHVGGGLSPNPRGVANYSIVSLTTEICWSLRLRRLISLGGFVSGVEWFICARSFWLVSRLKRKWKKLTLFCFPTCKKVWIVSQPHHDWWESVWTQSVYPTRLKYDWYNRASLHQWHILTRKSVYFL